MDEVLGRDDDIDMCQTSSDACVYEVCRDFDNDGTLSPEEAGRDCVQETFEGTIIDCEATCAPNGARSTAPP